MRSVCEGPRCRHQRKESAVDAPAVGGRWWSLSLMVGRLQPRARPFRHGICAVACRVIRTGPTKLIACEIRALAPVGTFSINMNRNLTIVDERTRAVRVGAASAVGFGVVQGLWS